MMQLKGLLKKELQTIVNTPNIIATYGDAMSSLYRSGIIAFLRAMGRVQLSHQTTSERVALDGAYAAGFQDCLDLLLNFEEIFLRPPTEQKPMPLDYGGVSSAVKRGDLTLEEAHAIRGRSTNLNT